MIDYDEENYAPPEKVAATSFPAPNTTLNLLLGNTDSGLYGPAAVAAEAADKFRKESIQLWKDAALSQAGVGNTFAVETAAQNISKLSSTTPFSYTDNVEEIASNQLEKLIALVQFQGEMGREDAIRNIELYSRNTAIRSVLEASLISLPERSGGVQLAQDLLGITAATEWFRLTPVINEVLQPYGADASLTKVGSAEEFYKVLANLNEEDAVKVIRTLTDRLVDADLIPLETSRRFFETVLNLTNESKAKETVFGVMEVVGVTTIARAALKGVLKASRPIATARAVGAESLISKDVAKALQGMKSDFGIDPATAVRMSLSANNEEMLAGMSAPIQKELRARLDAMRVALESSLSTGGATRAELEQSARAYSRTYSRENNPAIIQSTVAAREGQGDVLIDVLYGKRDGTVFTTKEEALEYWTKHLAGDLEVVPAAGDAVDFGRKTEQLNARANSLVLEIEQLSKASKKSGLKWAEDLLRGEQTTAQRIENVAQKMRAGESIEGSLDKAIEKYINAAGGDIEKAAETIGKSVPVTLRNKLRELEEVVAERVSLTSMPPRPGYALRQRVEMPVRLEDLGKMVQGELDSLSLVAGRLNPRLATATTLYKDTLVAFMKKGRVTKEWAKFVSTSFDKLSGKSMEKVVDALNQTQTLKREMTEAELYAMANITLDAEKEAYYAYRQMRNSLWQAKNEAARKDLVARGYRNVFSGLDELGEFSGPAKLEEDWSSLIGKQVLDAENNKFVTLSTDNLHELKARGLNLYSFKQAQEVPKHKAHATRVLLPVHKTTVGDIKTTIGRVDGAYSRIYEEEFFIKMHGNMVIDGEVEVVKYAFRTAASEFDAEQYAMGLNNLIAKGAAVTREDVSKLLGAYEDNADELVQAIRDGRYQGFTAKVNYTRLDDNFFRDVTGIGSSDVADGKVFWSKRSENAIKSITTGSNDAVISGPLYSLEREIGNAAMFTSMEEWRRNVIQRWYNEFEDVISAADKKMTKSAEDVFFKVVNRAHEYALSTPRTNAMLAQSRFIVNQLSVRTLDEKLMQHYMRKFSTLFDDVAETASSKMGRKDIPILSHFGPWLRRTDLPEFLKSAASNVMLAFLNVSQIVVQLASSANAILISPKHGLMSAYMARPILAALHASDNGKVWRGLHKMMGVVQYTGVKADEFERIALALKKTGLIDDVASSHMFSADTGVQHVFNGKMRKFKDSSWSFFSKAEEINRVVAFDIARREFIEANVGKAWDSEEALKAIMLRADDITTNMTRVNEARYAKGFGGLPLQFLQHSIRFGTTSYAGAKTLITGKTQTLTAKEATQLFVGSLLLYGVNNAGTPDFIEDVFGEASKTWDKDTKLLVGEGLVAYSFDQLHELFTGESAELAFGKRMSSLQWYEDVVDGLYTIWADQTIDLDTFTGPSGSFIKNIATAAGLGWNFVANEEKTVANTLATLNEMGATIVSTWSNATKAWYASQLDNTLSNKRGDATAKLSNPEVIYQALGISSIEAQESSYVFSNNKSHQRALKEITETLILLQRRQRRFYAGGDIKAAEDVDKAIRVLLLPLEDRPSDLKTVILGAAPRSAGSDSVIGEAMMKWDAQNRERTRILIGNEGNQ